MDHAHRQRQRQSNPSGYTGPPSLLSTPTQYPPGSAADRFRQTPLTAQPSPASAPSSTGRSAASYQSYGYGEGTPFMGPSMQAGALQYSADYAPDQQRGASQPYTSQYNSSMMYNVPAPQPQPQQQPQQQQQQQQQPQPPNPQAPYESVPPYPQRQSAATLEALTSQFGVPQQYYVAGEGGPTSAPSAAMATPNVPSHYAPPLSYTAQPSPVGREALAPAFAAAMSEPTAAGSQGAYPPTSYAVASAQGLSDLENAYHEYQRELRRTFEYVRDGRLREASKSLMDLTDWLLSNVEPLMRDDETLKPDRLKLWADFHTAWLTTLQAQLDMVQQSVQTGQRVHPPQTLIDYEFLEYMGKEMVRHCDHLEKHGLVDYEYGVLEEEVLCMIMKCLDQLESQPGFSGTPTSQSLQSGTLRHR